MTLVAELETFESVEVALLAIETGCVSVRSALSCNSARRVSCLAEVANPVIAAGGVMVESCVAVRTTGSDEAASCCPRAKATQPTCVRFTS